MNVAEKKKYEKTEADLEASLRARVAAGWAGASDLVTEGC